MFLNNKDSKNNIILKKNSYFLYDTDFKSNRIASEYALWANDFIIARMRESKFCLFNILNQHNLCSLKIKYIITETELALINGINNIFKNIIRIGCYFHLKYDIRNELNKLHYFTSDKKEETETVLNELGIIPLIYKGSLDLFDKFIDNIIIKHPSYENFINDYFIQYKKKYIIMKDYL